jgi:hypothetical protein
VEGHVPRDRQPLGHVPPGPIDQDHQHLPPTRVGVGGERRQGLAIRSAFTRGRMAVNDWPVAGRAKSYTYSQSYRVRPPEVGRRPLSAHTRRAIGLSPSRA